MPTTSEENPILPRQKRRATASRATAKASRLNAGSSQLWEENLISSHIFLVLVLFIGVKWYKIQKEQNYENLVKKGI